MAVALMVIGRVDVPPTRMSSNKARQSPRCATGTPTRPTSPRANS